MEALLGYILNAAWVVPMSLLAALALSRIVQLTPRAQCWFWTGFLVLALVLPMRLHLAPPPAAISAAPEVAQVHAMADLAPAAVNPPSADRGLTLAPWQGALLIDLLVLAVFVAAARLALGLFAAHRLTARSVPAMLPPEVEQRVWRFTTRRGGEPPAIRTTPGLSSPVVVGMWRPTVLLPEAFHRHGEAAMTAALLHECAHVLRRDYLANLACEILALPLAWHPALYPLKAGIRAARERACDRLASSDMASAENYARCLVDLARDMLKVPPPAGPALALFGRSGLENRVAAVLAKPETGGRAIQAGNLVALVGGVALVSSAALLLHVTPSFAEAVKAAPPTAEVAASPTPAAVSTASVARPAAKAAPARRAARGVVARPMEVDLDAAPDTAKGAVHYAAAGYFHRWTTAVGRGVAAFTPEAREPTAEEKSSLEAAARVGLAALPLQASGLRYLHRWTRADGRTIEAFTRDLHEPSAEQKSRLEAAQDQEFRRSAAPAARVIAVQPPRAITMQELVAQQKRGLAALARDNPELAARVNQAIETLKLPEVREALAKARRDDSP